MSTGIEWAREYAGVLSQRGEVVAVMLFGSYAQGTATEGSDVDLLVVVRDTDLVFVRRYPEYAPRRVPFDVDVLVYTKAEVDDMSTWSAVVREALGKGVLLFADPESERWLDQQRERAQQPLSAA